MENKKHKLETIQHFIIGFFLAFEGFDWIIQHPVMGSIILVFGVIILLYIVYQIFRPRQNRALNLAVQFFEGVALLFASYINYKEDKLYLQYILLFAAVGSFVSVIVMLLKKR